MNNALFANPQLFQAYQQDPGLAYGQALMQQGASTAPVRSPLEGLARALTAGVGGYTQSKARDKYQAQDESYRKGLTAALQGGDVLGALSASDDPTLKQMGLQAQIQRAMQPGEKDPLVQVFDPATKTMVYKPQSQAAGLQSAAPAEVKAPQTRQIHRGGTIVDQQFNPQTGQFEDVGSGPQFAPPQPPAQPEIMRLLQAAGIDPKSPQGQAAIAHAMDTDQQPKQPNIVTLYDPKTATPKSFYEGDPKIGPLMQEGWTEKGPGSNGITITNPDGTQTQIGGTQKAPNATASQAAGRGSLLATGMAAIKDVDFSKVSPEKVAAVGAAKSMLPNAAGNYIQAKAFNTEEQKLLAGQGAITEAVTAAITGAAYAPAQLTNYQNIFVPAAGEDPAVTVGKLQRGAIFLKQLDEMAAGSRLPVDQLPPEMIRVAVDKATAEPTQPAAAASPAIAPPAVGEVRKGFRFKGGNPSDKSSWEPAQ